MHTFGQTFLATAVLRVVSLLAVVTLLASCTGRATPVEASNKAFDELRAEVASVITDPKRAAEVTSLIDEKASALSGARVKRRQLIETYIKLSRDYRSTQEQIDALIETIDATMEANHERALELNRKLVAATTAEEWAELNKLHGRAFDRYMRSLTAEFRL